MIEVCALLGYLCRRDTQYIVLARGKRSVHCTALQEVYLSHSIAHAVPCVQGVVSTLLGFFLLGGVDFHAMNVLGIAINAIGGTW